MVKKHIAERIISKKNSNTRFYTQDSLRYLMWARLTIYLDCYISDKTDL